VRKKKDDAPVDGADRLAGLRKYTNELRLIKVRCTNLKRKSEWTLNDLSAFVKAVGEVVGVNFAE